MSRRFFTELLRRVYASETDPFQMLECFDLNRQTRIRSLGGALTIIRQTLAVMVYQCEREYPPPLGGRPPETQEREAGDGSERFVLRICSLALAFVDIPKNRLL